MTLFFIILKFEAIFFGKLCENLLKRFCFTTSIGQTLTQNGGRFEAFFCFVQFLIALFCFQNYFSKTFSWLSTPFKIGLAAFVQSPCLISHSIPLSLTA